MVSGKGDAHLCSVCRHDPMSCLLPADLTLGLQPPSSVVCPHICRYIYIYDVCVYIK